MSLLDGGISDVFGAVFGSIYGDAVLLKAQRTEDTGGDIVETVSGHGMKVHEPGRSEEYRAKAGFADTETEIIALQAGLSVQPSADDRLWQSGAMWSVIAAKPDGANSQWRIRARCWTGNLTAEDRAAIESVVGPIDG